MRILLTSAAAIALAAPAFADGHEAGESHEAAAVDIAAPAGTYRLDATHASLTWRVTHLGLARYTGRFIDFDATLQFDPENVENISVSASINPASVETDYSDIAPERRRDVDFDAEIADQAFNAGEFPVITFESVAVNINNNHLTAGDEHGGLAHAAVEGELSFNGVTAPVTLHVTLNGALAEHPFVGVGALGFSARGVLNRSEFGVDDWAGSVADDVLIEIEAEFIQQP